MTPAPASGGLNSHPELSAWRSLCVLMMQSSCSIMCAQWPLKLPRMSVMRVIVRTPSVYQVWSSKATPFRRYGYFGSWPSDVHWPLTFWPWNWCGISAVVLTTVLPILVFLLVFVVEQCINIRQTDDMTLLLWPSTFEVTAHVTDAVIVLHSCTMCEVRRSPPSGDMTHFPSQH